jgi:hypothetical protein
MSIFATVKTTAETPMEGTFPLRYKDGLPYLEFLELENDQILVIPLHPDRILLPNGSKRKLPTYQGLVHTADHQPRVEKRSLFK